MGDAFEQGTRLNPPLDEPPVRPAMPPLAPAGVGALGVLSRLRHNGLSAFPARCFEEPVVRMGLPGRALFIVSEGEAIAEMLQARSDDFVRAPAGRRVLGPVVGEGLLTSEGEAWRRQRKAMAPAFGPRALPMMAAHVIRASHPVVDRLAATAGQPVDLLAEMQALSLEIAAVSMFSVETEGFRSELRQRISGYMTGPGRPAPEDFLAPAWLPTPLTLRRRAFRRDWLTLMTGVVVKRRGAGTSAGGARDLFDLLADAHGAEAQALLVDEVATMLIAGHETTALTLFWSLHMLAQSPGWRRLVTEEAAALDLSVDTAAADLPKLMVTRAVVNEVLRLFSPAFLTARVARRATSVGGHAVPKGSFMLAPFWMTHRRPAAWPGPSRFDPSRFMPGGARDRAQFLPFGAGPHVCIGAQLAMSEAVLVLALLARRLSPERVDPTRPVLPVATLSTRPDHAPAFCFKAVEDRGAGGYKT